MLAIPLAALLSLVTIVDRGLVYQPALSPDGTKVAYAADEAGGTSIYVAPAAGGASVKVATIADKTYGPRLAATALEQGPWSPDGARLLYLAKSADSPDVTLWVVGADGQGAARIGPETGLVENAAFVPATGRIAFTHRDSRRAYKETLATIKPDGTEQQTVYEFTKSEVIVSLAPSPDGAWVAALMLTGPRDERARSLVAIDTRGRRLQVLESPSLANFLTWAPDGSKLFFVDAIEKRAAEQSDSAYESFLGMWPAGSGSLAPPPVPEDVARALPVLDGSVVLLTNGKGALEAVALDAPERHTLGSGVIATSATKSKVALLRRGAPGAAIMVADVTREALLSGDIGLPKEAPQEPASPAPAGGTGEQPHAPPAGGADEQPAAPTGTATGPG
jgi:hypothetical protein